MTLVYLFVGLGIALARVGASRMPTWHDSEESAIVTVGSIGVGILWVLVWSAFWLIAEVWLIANDEASI